MKISIVIPCVDARYLEVVLPVCLLQQEYIEEILVIEDWVYQDDKSIAHICYKYGCSHYRLPYPKRLASDCRTSDCRTMGQELAKGDIVLFMDQDTIPSPQFMKRTVEIHSTHDRLLFGSERLFLSEKIEEALNVDMVGISNIWAGRQPNPPPIQILDSFFQCDSTNRTVVGAWGHNMSIQRKYIPLVGKWEYLYGYGEEDLYWGYKCFNNDIRIGINEYGLDLYVCHIDHDRFSSLNIDFAIMNKLYLCEIDPGFAEALRKTYAMQNIQPSDWCFHEMNALLKSGINASPAFYDLPYVPECLHKYMRNQETGEKWSE